MEVNMHQAKTHLSKLIAAVESGEEVVIARAGKPVAKLVLAAPSPARSRKEMRGSAAGIIWLSKDAFTSEADAAVLALFDAEAARG